MSGSEYASSINYARLASVRARLFASRMFGLAILGALLISRSYWQVSGSQFLAESLAVAGIVLATSGFLGRLWCLCHIVGRKNVVLVTQGPYSLCRHPLYFFSLLGGIGLAFCTKTLTIPIVFAAAFAVSYAAALRREEVNLNQTFPDYAKYSERIPSFVPTTRGYVPAGIVTVRSRDLARAAIESGSLISAIALIDLIDALHHAGVLPTYLILP